MELIVTCEDTMVKVVNTQTQALVGTLRGHRSPADCISVQSQRGSLVLTASRDCVILWDSRDWTRFRTLHHGPDVENAQFSFFPHQQASVIGACFDNDTILFWNLASFEQMCQLALPEHEEPPGLRRFSVSTDGLTAVAVGRNSFLYMWDISSQTLLRIVQLPSRIALIQQLAFLPGASPIRSSSSTVSLLGDDGQLNFINIHSKEPKVGLQINSSPKVISHYALDMYGKYLISGTSDGCLLLHDLDVAREFSKQNRIKTQQIVRVTDENEDQPLSTRSAFGFGTQSSSHSTTRTRRKNKNSADFASSLPSANVQNKQTKNSNQHEDPIMTFSRPTSKLVDTIFGATKSTSAAVTAKNSTSDKKTTIHSRSMMKRKTEHASSVFHLAQLTEKETHINHARVQSLLQTYGQYPEKYRLLIWRFLLCLPENKEAFVNLCSKGNHMAFVRLHEKYPLQNQRLSQRLLRILSALTYWCPVLGEVSYLPALVFPFVKMFPTDDLSAFETCMSILLHWAKDWFQTFPHPPLHVLSNFETYLAQKDAPLYNHFVALEITSQIYAWNLLRTGFTEIFSKDEWLRVWDHFFTSMATHPNILYAAVFAYLQYFRTSFLSTKDSFALEQFFHQQNAIDMSRFIQLMLSIVGAQDWQDHFSALTKDDSNDLDSDQDDQPSLWPLSQGQYPIFQQYPKTIVNYQLQERARIAFEEEELLQKRQLLQELEVQTKDLQDRHEQWKEQHVSVREAEEKRRLESALEGRRRLTERRMMEEQTRQRRLHQCLTLEQQAKESFVHQMKMQESEALRMKEEWALAKEKEEYELEARQEEERICALEFETMQRIKQLQDEKQMQERFASIRENIQHQMKQDEFQHEKEYVEWAKEDQCRRLNQQLDVEQAQRQTQLEHERVFQTQLSQERREKQMSLEMERLKLQQDRKLRLIQEEQVRAQERAHVRERNLQEEELRRQEQAQLEQRNIRHQEKDKLDREETPTAQLAKELRGQEARDGQMEEFSTSYAVNETQQPLTHQVETLLRQYKLEQPLSNDSDDDNDSVHDLSFEEDTSNDTVQNIKEMPLDFSSPGGSSQSSSVSSSLPSHHLNLKSTSVTTTFPEETRFAVHAVSPASSSSNSSAAPSSAVLRELQKVLREQCETSQP